MWATRWRAAAVGLAVTGGVLAVATMASGDPGEAPRWSCDEAVQVQLVRGILDRSGDRFVLNGEDIDFGPDWYVTSTTARHDYDGDGTPETLRAEVDGLLGRVVELAVDRPGRGGDRDVYAINEVPYREAGCPPPWAGGPAGPPPWARPPGR